MGILDVSTEWLTFNMAGRSSRGTYIANHWYGQQDILLRHAGMDPKSALYGKLQIGWQTGKNMGLDGEQGFKEVVKIHRLPFFVWNAERLKLAEQQGMTWGTATGAPFLYKDYGTYSEEKIQSAIAFPSHSIPEYAIKNGWGEFAVDFVLWSKSMGLGATICLHPNDYENVTIREALDCVKVEATCCGGLFYTDYLQRFADLVRVHEVVVVNKASSPMFYAAALNAPVYCRGKLPVTDPIHPDEPLVDCDPAWIQKNFPWTINGTDGRQSALDELGQSCMLSKEGLFELFTKSKDADGAFID